MEGRIRPFVLRSHDGRGGNVRLTLFYLILGAGSVRFCNTLLYPTLRTQYMIKGETDRCLLFYLFLDSRPCVLRNRLHLDLGEFFSLEGDLDNWTFETTVWTLGGAGGGEFSKSEFCYFSSEDDLDNRTSETTFGFFFKGDGMKLRQTDFCHFLG